MGMPVEESGELLHDHISIDGHRRVKEKVLHFAIDVLPVGADATMRNIVVQESSQPRANFAIGRASVGHKVLEHTPLGRRQNF